MRIKKLKRKWEKKCYNELKWNKLIEIIKMKKEKENLWIKWILNKDYWMNNWENIENILNRIKRIVR